MVILAIETATIVCSVAVLRGESIRASRTEIAPQRHAELLLPAIEYVMSRARVRPEDLDTVAVSIGPGSFTGLRIGLSVAKGIVEGTGCRLVPVPSAESAAYQVFRTGTRNHVSVIIPARKYEYYYARYGFGSPVPVALHMPEACSIDDLRAKLDSAGEDVIAGEGITRLLNDTSGDLAIEERLKESIDREYNIMSAESIGMFAPHHDPVGVEESEPLYIKHFQSGSVRNPV